TSLKQIKQLHDGEFGLGGSPATVFMKVFQRLKQFGAGRCPPKRIPKGKGSGASESPDPTPKP
ncbi:MAG: hypothetical protein ACP5JW_08190, partial [Candidatus Bathyarchaeia archaeon]